MEKVVSSEGEGEHAFTTLRETRVYLLLSSLAKREKREKTRRGRRREKRGGNGRRIREEKLREEEEEVEEEEGISQAASQPASPSVNPSRLLFVTRSLTYSLATRCVN